MKAASGSIFNFARNRGSSGSSSGGGISYRNGSGRGSDKNNKSILTRISDFLTSGAERAASRQQSKKTHTEKVGESRNPNPTKKTTNAQKESKRYLKKELDAEKISKITYKDRKDFTDDIAKSINAWFPSFSANGSTRQEVPIGESI